MYVRMYVCMYMYICMYYVAFVLCMYVRLSVSCSNSINAERIFKRPDTIKFYGKLPQFHIYWAEQWKQMKQKHNGRNITIEDEVKETV